jgi:YesN/AraC family two-component response regulator
MVMDQDSKKAIDSGFTNFISKPYKKDELLSLLDSIHDKI